MTHLVDLTKKPFNLNQEAIEWIEKTINEMTLDEKIGQLFFNMGASRSTDKVEIADVDCCKYRSWWRRCCHGWN